MNLSPFVYKKGAAIFKQSCSNIAGYRCRVSGVPPGRECSEDFGGLAIMAVRRTLTGSRGENLRVVGIHSDG